MAIVVSNGTTRITPTAWKWYAGAGIQGLISLFMPEYGWAWALGAVAFAVFGSGKLTYLQLDRQKLTIRYVFGKKEFAWDTITDFRLMKVKSGFITAGTMVSFTKVSQEGSMYAKAAKFFSGGTQSASAMGIKPKTLLMLMSAYKQNLIVSDSIIAQILGKAKFTKGNSPGRQVAGSANAANVQSLPVAKAASGAGGSMSAADMAMRRAIAERRGGQVPETDSVPAPRPAQSGFGKAKPAVKPRATFGKSKTSSPLIQDSASRRRRTGN